MEKSPPEDVIQPAPEKPRLSNRLRRTLLAGLTVIAPLWITGLVLLKLFEWAAGFSRPLIKPFAAVLGDPDWYYRAVCCRMVARRWSGYLSCARSTRLFNA